MNTTIHDIARFLENISSISKGVEIDESSHEEIDRYISGDVNYHDEEAFAVSEDIKEEVGVTVPEKYNYLYVLQGEGIRWSRPERKSKEGYLSGGFYMNGVMDIFLYTLDFWKKPIHEFSKIRCEHLADMPENMRWFESASMHNDPEIYTPQYGCVLFDPPSFPDKFFYYDSGLLYSLPFTSFEDYFSAMISCAAVSCWQYFYVDPEEIIYKNKGLSYITWSLHKTTHLDEKMRSLIFDETITYDRLDLINEYLERCVRLLPGAFPAIDFSHHREYYDRFKELYETETKARVVLQTNYPHKTTLASFALSPNGEYLATGAWVGDDYDAGGSLAIWEVATGRCVNKIPIEGGVGWPGEGNCLQWHSDNATVGVAHDTNGIGSIDAFMEHRGVFNTAYVTNGMDCPPVWCFSPDGKSVFVACRGESSDYSPLSGIIAPLVGRKKSQSMSSTDEATEDIDSFKTVKWRSDDIIAGFNREGQSFAIDAQKRDVLWQYDEQKALGISPDGKTLIVTDKTLSLLDTATGEAISLAGAPAGAKDIVFSPDSECFAAIDEDIRIFKNHQLIVTLPVVPAQVEYFMPDLKTTVFSPDGLMLAVLSREGRLQAWDLHNAQAQLEPVLDMDAAAWTGIFWAHDTIIAASEQKLAFIDIANSEIRTEYDLFAFPAEDPVSDAFTEKGLQAFPMGEKWGYVKDSIVIAEQDPGQAVQRVEKFRHAKPLDGVQVFADFQAAAKLAPKILVKKLTSHFSKKRKSKSKLPFPVENEHAEEDLLEFLIDTLFEADARYPSGVISKYLGEVALHFVLEKNYDRADKLLDAIDIHAEAGAASIAHVCAYLARDGESELATKHLQRAEQTYEGMENGIVTNWISFAPWVCVTKYFLNDGDDEYFENALSQFNENSLFSDRKKPLAKAYAMMGHVEKAIDIGIEDDRDLWSSWDGWSEFFDLALSSSDIKTVHRFMQKMHDKEIKHPHESMGYFLDLCAGFGQPEATWDIIRKYFSEQSTHSVEWDIAERVGEMKGGQALFDMIGSSLAEAENNGWQSTQAKLLSVWTQYAPEQAQEKLLSFARRIEISSLDEWAITGVLNALCRVLPAIGETALLMDILQQAVTGKHWGSLLEALEPEHAYYDTALTAALSSNKANLEAYLRGTKKHTEFYEMMFQSCLETAGRDRYQLERLTGACGAVGDFEKANLVRMKVTKNNRSAATSELAREAIKIGHFSAAIAMLKELDKGSSTHGWGTHGREFEAMQGLIQYRWDGVCRVSRD